MDEGAENGDPGKDGIPRLKKRGLAAGLGVNGQGRTEASMGIAAGDAAGDGYLASNERELIFGLASATTVPTMTVKWPSGLEEQFHNLAVNRRWTVIEKRGDPLLMPTR